MRGLSGASAHITYTNPQTASLVTSMANTVFDRCELYFDYECYGSVTWYNGNAYADCAR